MISLQDGRKELFQWDTNRRIKLNETVGEVSEVHFANGVFARSIDVKAENGEALIPDVLLQYAKPLKVWLFVGETNNGYTKVEHTFQVKERNKPSDYVYTPTEQISLQELIDKFEDFKDSIGNEVEDYLKENPITFEETDPTVPQWAKEKNKPSYTADEVGALSKDTKILTTEEVVDEIEQYMQDHPMLVEETDPTVPEWAKQPEKPTYTPEEIGAQPKGDYALKSEIPSVPVQSVNGKTGKVELTAEDVGALPEDTIIPAPYELPTASADVKGGVKVGSGLQMDGEVLGVKDEKYELIETITLEEPMVIQRTEKPNGTPYKFKKLFIEASALTTVESGNKRITATLGRSWESVATYIIDLKKTDYSKHGGVEFISDDGLWRTRAYPMIQSNSGYQVVYCNAYYEGRYKYEVSGPITKIETTELPAGVTLNIMGVRADA